MKFKSWKDGIQAHADHLGLYAGAKNCPKYSPETKNYQNEKYKANGTTLDPRHFTYLYGKCPTVEGLSGTWATDKKYAKTLLGIIAKIHNTKVPEKVVVKEEPKVKYANGTYNRKAKVTASALNVRRGRPGSPGYKNIVGKYKFLQLEYNQTLCYHLNQHDYLPLQKHNLLEHQCCNMVH